MIQQIYGANVDRWIKKKFHMQRIYVLSLYFYMIVANKESYIIEMRFRITYQVEFLFISSY